MDFKQEAIVVYSEFKAQLVELAELNKSLVFVYEDDEDNKKARSHIAKLRKVKTAIEARRKEAKADALEYGRQLDARAKELSGSVDEMIDVHMKPLQVIEEKEKDRRRQVEMFLQHAEAAKTAHGESEILYNIRRLEDWEITPEIFKDDCEPAKEVLAKSLETLNRRLEETRRVEREREELAEFKRKEAEQARIKAEQEAKLARERAEIEAEKARIEAQRKKLEADAMLLKVRESTPLPTIPHMMPEPELPQAFVDEIVGEGRPLEVQEEEPKIKWTTANVPDGNHPCGDAYALGNVFTTLVEIGVTRGIASQICDRLRNNNFPNLALVE